MYLRVRVRVMIRMHILHRITDITILYTKVSDHNTVDWTLETHLHK